MGLASNETIYHRPSAFADEETLVMTLAHERTHIYQDRVFGRQSTDATQDFETAAYGIEDSFWELFTGGRP